LNEQAKKVRDVKTIEQKNAGLAAGSTLCFLSSKSLFFHSVGLCIFDKGKQLLKTFFFSQKLH